MQLSINNSIPFKYYAPKAAHDPRISELLWISGEICFSMEGRESGFCRAERQELVVLAVKKGLMSVKCQDKCRNLFEGQIMLVHSGLEQCELESGDSAEAAALVFEGSLIDQVMHEHFQEDRLYCRNLLPEVITLVKLVENDRVKAHEYSAAAYRFLLELYDAAQEYQEESGLPLLVQTAIGIMDEEFAYLDGVSDVAQRLEVTESHLIRVFSRSAGISPGKYLKRCRIAHAKILLAQPEMTVALAAQMSGFSSADYFSKSFRRETGMSPGEYVRSCTGKQKSSQKARMLLDEAYL